MVLSALVNMYVFKSILFDECHLANSLPGIRETISVMMIPGAAKAAITDEPEKKHPPYGYSIRRITI